MAIAALSDGRKVVVAVTPGYRESTESWADVLRELRDRGMNAPKLIIGDGHLGIWEMLLVAEKRFRRLDAPLLMKEVFAGTTFVDGIRSTKETGRKAA